ncbi:MAG: DUF2232 domain-containing protein [Nitrospiria bacterium]
MAIGKKSPWVEIAFITVVTLFLATSIYYRNWTGFAVGLFSFTPLALFYLQYQWKVFLPVSFLLATGFFLFLGKYEALFLVFTYLVSSIIIGEMTRRGKPVEQVVLTGIIPPLLSGTGMWFLQALKNHIDPILSFYQLIRQNLNETIHYYEKIGMDKEKIDFLNASLNDLTTVIFYLFPGMYLIGLIFTIFLNYLLVRFILIKLNTLVLRFTPLTSWFAQDYWVWGFIFSGILLILPFPPAKIIGGNLFLLFMLLYFFQGLALVADFFKRRNIRPFWQAISYFLLLIWPLLSSVVALFGLFDIWADFRKVRV